MILCPSNPFVSIGPILALPGLRELLEHAGVPVVAVSPFIGGQAVKGPAAKMMTELGAPVSNDALAEHYRGIVTAWVIDRPTANRPMACGARAWRAGRCRR